MNKYLPASACSASRSPACSPRSWRAWRRTSPPSTRYGPTTSGRTISGPAARTATTCGSAAITTVVGVFIGILTAFIAAVIQQHRQLPPDALLVLQRAHLRRLHRRHGVAQGRPRLRVLGAWSSAPCLPSARGCSTRGHVLSFRSDLAETQWGAIVGFVAGLIAMVIATRFRHAEAAGRAQGPGPGASVEDEQDREDRPRALVQVCRCCRGRRPAPLRPSLRLHLAGWCR